MSMAMLMAIVRGITAGGPYVRVGGVRRRYRSAPMSITVTGTVVDENGDPIAGILVEARGDVLLTRAVADEDRTASNGDFTLVMPGVSGQPTVTVTVRVRVVDDVGRSVCDDREVSA